MEVWARFLSLIHEIHAKSPWNTLQMILTVSCLKKLQQMVSFPLSLPLNIGIFTSSPGQQFLGPRSTQILFTAGGSAHWKLLPVNYVCIPRLCIFCCLERDIGLWLRWPFHQGLLMTVSCSEVNEITDSNWFVSLSFILPDCASSQSWQGVRTLE